MSTANSSRSAANTASSQEEGPTRRTPQGIRVVESVGNLTKEPYVGEKMASLQVAFNNRVMDRDGEYQDGTPTVATVKLVGDARKEGPIDYLQKGSEIKVAGTLTTELSKDINPKTNKPYENLVITVFDPANIEVTRQPGERKAAGNGSQVASRAPAAEVDQEAERRPAARQAQPTNNRAGGRQQYR